MPRPGGPDATVVDRPRASRALVGVWLGARSARPYDTQKPVGRCHALKIRPTGRLVPSGPSRGPTGCRRRPGAATRRRTRTVHDWHGRTGKARVSSLLRLLREVTGDAA